MNDMQSQLMFFIVMLVTSSFTNAQTSKQLTIDNIKMVKSAADSKVTADVKLLYDKIDNAYNIYTSQIEYLIDMGFNYDITSVKIMYDDKSFKIRASVGFKIDVPAQSFACQFKDSGSECTPKCGYSTYARFIYLVVSREKVSWFKAYEIKVFGQKVAGKSDDLAFKRPYLPMDCSLNAGEIISKIGKAQPTIKNELFEVALNGIYGIKRISFMADKGNSIDVSLVDNSGNSNDLTIQQADCKTDSDNLMTCLIPNEKSALSTMRIKVRAPGLSRLEVYGDPIYYPVLQSKKRKDDEKLYLTFTEMSCDVKQHSNCDRKGITYQCGEVVVSRKDKNASIVISEGETIHSNWATATQFAVKKDNKGGVVLTVPRSYKYIGSYFSKCILNDVKKTEISSDLADIVAEDVDDGLNANTVFQYGEDEDQSGELKYFDLINNIIPLKYFSSYFGIKITFHSISEDVQFKTEFWQGEETVTDADVSKRGKSSVAVFPSVKNSWNISMFQYVVNIEPDVKEAIIPLNWTSAKLQKSVSDKLVVVDLHKEGNSDKLYVWKWLRTPHMVEFRAFTQSKTAYALKLTEKNCGGEDSHIDRTTLQDSQCKPGSFGECFSLSDGYVAIIRVKNAPSTSAYTLTAFDLSKKLLTLTSDSVDTKGMKQKLKDIKLTPKILSLNSISKTVKVEVAVDSKVLMDFAKCGKVIVKLTLPDKSSSELVLTDNFFQTAVTPLPDQKTFDLTVQILLEDSKSISEQSPLFNLTLTNPFKLQISNYKRADGKRVQFSWGQVSEDVYSVVKEFQVLIQSTVQACQQDNANETYTIKKQEVYSPKSIYSSPLVNIPQDKIIEFNVTLRVVFEDSNNPDNYYGEALQDNFVTGSRKTGTIVTVGDNQTTSHQVKLTAGQLNLPCQFESADFELKMLDGLDVSPTFKRLEDDTYQIGTLIPGRKYEVKAVVKYKKGEDYPTASVNFETLDDIRVPARVIAQEDSPVKINCSSELGSGKFKKSLEWKVTRRQPLHNGVTFKSHPDGTAQLVIAKPKPFQSDTYQCYINPQIEGSKAATVDVIITPVRISPTQVVASMGGEFTITCTGMKSEDFSSLEWSKVSATGEFEKVADSLVKDVPQDNPEVQQLVLTVSDVTLKDTGKYACRQEFQSKPKLGMQGRVVNVVLVENAAITEVKESQSYLVGDKRVVKCGGTLAHMQQKPTWKLSVADEKNLALSRSADSHILTITSTLANSGKEFLCRIEPPTEGGKVKGTTTFTHKVNPGVKLEKTSQSVVVGKSLEFPCYAYPNETGQMARWVKAGTPDPTVQSSFVISRVQAMESEGAVKYNDAQSNSSDTSDDKMLPAATTLPPPPPTTAKPSPRFTEIKKSDGSKLTKSEPEQSTIYFKSIDYKDAGQYECQLVNSQGQTLMKKVLKIEVTEKKKEAAAGSRDGKIISGNQSGGGGGKGGSSHLSVLSSLVLISVLFSLTWRRS